MSIQTAVFAASQVITGNAGGGNGGGSFNSDGISDWVRNNVLPLILLFIGIGIMAGARKGDTSKTMTTSLIAIVGIIFCVAAVAIIAFGESMGNLVID